MYFKVFIVIILQLTHIGTQFRKYSSRKLYNNLQFNVYAVAIFSLLNREITRDELFRTCVLLHTSHTTANIF
jgi:hypothetical protein